MKKLLSSTFCLTLMACGVDKGKDSNEKEAEASSDVEFSGYVQKAFTIKVNSQEFSDSEDFYTRFIEELVKPTYPDVTDVKLEGKYGLDEFGSQSKVYMSSMAAEGHLYEGRTDAQSKFTIKVQTKALDETFKARVVVRIGLEVSEVGADDLHYCYLLHGNKEGIAISEASKPIIFEEFATQLTKYRCEDVDEDALVIPGIDGGGSDPGDSSEARLRATVGTATTIASSLGAAYEGANELTSATFGTGWVFAKAPVMRKADGKWCIPVVHTVEDCLGSYDQKPQAITSLSALGGSMLATTESATITFKLDGSQWDSVPSTKVHHRVVGEKYLDGKEVCDWPGDGCVAAPTSNKCDLGYPKALASYGGAYVAANGVNSQGSAYCGAGAIHVLSESLAYQKKYPVSTLDVPAADFAASKLVTSDGKLYLVTLKDDNILIRKLDLTEE